jgi:hypothetical protein
LLAFYGSGDVDTSLRDKTVAAKNDGESV